MMETNTEDLIKLKQSLNRIVKDVFKYSTDGIGCGRKTVITTGKSGMIAFDKAVSKEAHFMEIQNAKDKADWLVNIGKLTSDECKSIYSMLDSEDIENFYLGIQLIDIKTTEYHKTNIKHHGTTI